MTLKDLFNSSTYAFRRLGDAVLSVSVNGSVSVHHYDFGQRLLTIFAIESVSTQPFSQLDREVLIEMRDKLVALGGKPPELPPEKPSGPPVAGRLNL